MKFVIYLFPAMINFIASGVFFYVTQRFVDAGASKLLTSLVVPTWALVYCLVNLVVIRIVNSNNAAKLIINGGIIFAASSLGFIFLDSPAFLLVWTGLLGAGFGFYCGPFQLLCKNMERGSSSGVAMATGKYTAAWSLGFASGAVVFGMLNYITAFSLSFVVGVAVAVGVYIIKRKLEKVPTEVEAITVAPAVETENRFPDFAWVGWIVGSMVTFSMSQLRSMLQPHGAAIGLVNVRETMALTLMTVSLVQGIVGLLLCRSRVWMYKLFNITVFGLTGVISLAGFCFAGNLWQFLLTAVVCGIYSGCGYFIFVYYSLAHPTKAGRNASINEIAVSIASISAPMLGGLLVDNTGFSWIPFALAGTCVLIATLFHMTVFTVSKQRKAALKEN